MCVVACFLHDECVYVAGHLHEIKILKTAEHSGHSFSVGLAA